MHEVILRDLSSGRFHKGALDGESLLTHEADNLDQSGKYEIVDNLPPDVDMKLLCQRCFVEAS